MPKRLYFIAIELPEPFKSDITDWKEELSQRYNSKHALKTAPHVTLQMPMRIEETRENELLSSLETLNDSLPAGIVELKNISSFPPKTVFIDVLPSDFLNKLFEAVQEVLHKAGFIETQKSSSTFHAHVTLLNRDLDQEFYQKALKELKDIPYSKTITIKSFVLYRHDGKFWRVLREFGLVSSEFGD